MSFNSALTAGNYTSLRGSASVSPSHSATLYVSVCPNNNIYTARVNQASFAASFAQLTYDGGSGTLADVRVGMTVLISHTNSRPAAFFVGRVRKTPGASTLYINETSAPVADNDYIFVIDDYRIWDKLARFVDPTLYPDYDVSFRQLLPRIYGLRSAYVVMTDGSDGTFAFAPSVAASTSGASISTYLWEVGDGTITVGTSATQNITATFPPGFRWVHFTVTDSGSRSSVRHIPIWVHDDANPPAPLEIGDFEWTATIDDGYSGSLPAFDGIDTLLDNTLVLAWVDQERYNGTLANIVSNIVLLGRFRIEKSTTTFDDVGQQDATTRFDIEGPLQTLGRLEINPVEIISKSSPTAFCEIKDCTPWRETVLILSEFSTFSELHSLDFDNSGSTYLDLGVTVPLGSILNGVNSDLFSINANLQMNGAGQAEAVRDAMLIPSASRSSLVNVANWTTADILGLDYEHDEVNVIGRSLASGGSYSINSGKITITNSIAPGVAQDYPEGSTTLDRQVLAANQNKTQAAIELNARNGHWLARSQGFDTLIVDHPDGYWWLTPSQNQWYTFTLDGSETARGIVLDTNTRWALTEIRGTYNLQSGTFDVQATYHKETSGTPGQTIVYPPQTIEPLTLPSLPPIPPFPAFDIGDFFLPDDLPSPDISPPALFGSLTTTAKHDGNTVLVWSRSGLWVCNDFLSQLTPTWVDITPQLETGAAIVGARFVNAPNPGVFAITRGGAWAQDFDFSVSDGGWTGTNAIYSGGRWNSVSGGGNTRLCNITISFSSTVVTSISIQGYASDVANGGTRNISSGAELQALPTGAGAIAGTWVGSQALTSIAVAIDINAPPGAAEASILRVTVTGEGSNPFGGIATSPGQSYYRANAFDTGTDWTANALPINTPELFRIGETYSDIYIYDPSGASTYYSSNRGATWGSVISVGTTPGDMAGFDTGKLGTVSLAAADGLVRKATTQGGAYSDYATLPTDNIATAIFVPRYTFLGANNGAGVSSPDFLFASAVPASGTGNTLWKVTVAGSAFGNISPTDGGNKGTAVSPDCIHMPWYSTAYQDIMAILDFAGTRKLAVSVDSGSSWVLTGALAASAGYLTTRRSDTRRRQLFIVNGSNLGYCSNYQSNPLILAARVGPSSDVLSGIDVLP